MHIPQEKFLAFLFIMTFVNAIEILKTHFVNISMVVPTK